MSKPNGLHFDPSKWKLRFIECPFKLFKLSDVFLNKIDVLNLAKEANDLQFLHQLNDLYQFSRTNELYHLKSDATRPYLSAFLEFLDTFAEFLSIYFNVTIDKVSVSGAKYSQGDFLLCHDDLSSDRYIAFIFYLNPCWQPKWGGSLDIFDHEKTGSPSNIVHSLLPDFNSLVFFQVCNESHHQVAEVLTKETARLTLNGWFHSKEALKLEPIIDIESALTFANAHDRGVTLYLHHFATEQFQHEKYTGLIAETIRENGCMMLQDFLKGNVYAQISKELHSKRISWSRKGPVNRRCYNTADLKTLPLCTKSLVNFFSSRSMCSFLESVTDYELSEKNRDNASVGSVFVELQSWKGGDYSTMSDRELNFKHSTLDVLLFFNVVKEIGESSGADSELLAGNIYYNKKRRTFAHFIVEPYDNSICLALKKKNEASFVSYINRSTSTKYHVLRASYKLYF